MIFAFGNYELDIDVEKTRQFYQNSPQELTDGCDCAGCRNFREAYKQSMPEVKTFFEQLGVDILKAPDLSAFNGDIEKKTLSYGGFCHLCGTILKSGMVKTTEAPNCVRAETESWYEVAEGLSVMFAEDCALLEKDFPTPVVQMEIRINVPWVLEGEEHYLLT